MGELLPIYIVNYHLIFRPFHYFQIPNFNIVYKLHNIFQMKKNYRHSSFIFFLVLVLIFATAFSIISVDARKHHSKKSKIHHKHRKQQRNGGGNSAPNCSNPLSPAPSPTPTQSHIFAILSFGAKGDGVSDDTKVNQSKLRKI